MPNKTGKQKEQAEEMCLKCVSGGHPKTDKKKYGQRHHYKTDKPNKVGKHTKVDEMFARAILKWAEQGRSEEQIHAINNFNTGVGVKLKKDIAALIQSAEREARQREGVWWSNSLVGMYETLAFINATGGDKAAYEKLAVDIIEVLNQRLAQLKAKEQSNG